MRETACRELLPTSDETAIVPRGWAHVRRKFDEALKTLAEKGRQNSSVAIGKRYCDKLFELERTFVDLSPQERFEKRQVLAKPLLDEFFVWAGNFINMPKTSIGKAAHYALSKRVYLERYLLDGRLEISNKRTERSIKAFVIDRKNFLFANTPRGAMASAVMFSLIETAKENGLNPIKYLVHVFKNAPNWDVRNNVDMFEFLIPHLLSDSYKAGLSG